MKLTKVVKWESLTEQERLNLAKEVVAQRRKRWLRAYKNVFAVSAAPHRTRGRGLTFRLHPEVVIRFYVSAKPLQPNAHEHVAGRPRIPGHVPRTVSAFIVSHGKKVRVSIPTDVYLEAGTLHAATVAPTFYGQPPGNASWVSGSACCLLTVKDFEGNTYLLGCHHVFCGSDLSPTLQEIPGTVVEFGPDRVSLGQAAYKGNFPRGPDGYAMDAAFVDVTDYIGVLPDYFLSGRIKGLAEFAQYPEPGEQLTILTPNGDKLGHYDNAEDDFILPAQGNGGGSVELKFKSLFSYTAPCQEGDSGSAVIDRQGTLFGLHIHGPDTAKAIGGLCHAIHIAEVVKATTVGTLNDWTLA